MERELKRVAIDFDWPVGKTWDGFLNPHYKECAACSGRGSTAAKNQLDHVMGDLLYSRDCGPDMAELTGGLAGRPPRPPLGHDTIDCWSATTKVIAAAGLPDSWGTCTACDGEGIDQENIKAFNAWEPTAPPTGDGYQIWETVSEGSPISPVFATPKELAMHMAGTRWGADRGSSAEQWLAFINGPGWAPSMVMTSKGIETGPIVQ